MDSVFVWIENSTLSVWIRESLSIFAFPAIVTLHTIGMGFLAGGSAAIDLRILGFAPRLPLKAMAKFFPVLWLALAINVASGILLLTAYPTKALTNPVFYVKMSFIALALWVLHRIKVELLRGPAPDHGALPARAKRLAAASLSCWVLAITAGRLLAYTHTWVTFGQRALY